MTSGVYQILNTANGKCYVGSSANMERRRRDHFGGLQNGRHHSTKLTRAYAKHGAGAFVFEQIETCDPSENLVREEFWIREKNAVERGYNTRLVPYSSLGLRASEETKAKLSSMRKGKSTWSPEARAKLALTMAGVWEVRKRANGETPSENKTPKVSRQKSGWVQSEETKLKISAARTGKKHSAETKLKIGNASLGRTFTPDTLEKISAAARGRVRQKGNSRKPSVDTPVL